MSIEWFDPENKLPLDGDECLLMPHDDGGLLTVGVYGPIQWNEKQQAWLDIFRDPEAGSIVSKAEVGCWTLWDPIAPPDDLPTPTPG